MSSKKKESFDRPSRWNPDSSRNRHRVSGSDQIDPDSNKNEGKFPPIEQELEQACDFGMPKTSKLKFDFEELKSLFSQQ
jgi:hypothetical protein